MTIRHKLVLAFGAVLLLVGGLALYAITALATAGDLVVRLYDEPLLAVNHARSANAKFNKARATLEHALIISDSTADDRTDALDGSIGDILADLKIVSERVKNDEVVAAGHRAALLISEWYDTGLKILRPGRSGLTEVPLSAAVAKKADAAAAAIDDVVELAAAYGFGFRSMAEAKVKTVSSSMLALAIATAIVGIVLSLAFAYSISRPIGTATAIAERVAAGNFSDAIASTRRDELGRLLRSLAHMQASLRLKAEADKAQIAHMTTHDPLTDLPNRAAFAEHLATTLERAAAAKDSFAVLCVDLDRFKEINDVFGHDVGDVLLREVSARLRNVAEGAFVARVGGDEFMLIATDGAQPTTAEIIAERLLAALAEDIAIDVQKLRIGISIGVAIFPTDGADTTTLLANADAALDRAKADGRGGMRFFEPDMDKRLRERRALQHELRSALERSELGLHYQPQARIGGEIIGFEALVRWQHPTRGMISPGTFIPLAEESGAIIAIGEWILREACREAASWPQPLQVAVNLSPIQFRHGDLAALVHAVLLETGLPPRRLEVEITEGVLIADFDRAISILRRLKSFGVRIAMDDFGTGYSSLSYLQSFPFDKIKIDQAFISNLESNVQSAAIVRAVISLGRGLHLPVIAEGVETKDQLAFLSRELCDEVQGYLIGRPRPIADYAELVGQPKPAQPAAALAG